MSKKCTPLWRDAHFQVKMYNAHQLRTTFGSCDDEKAHAVVGRSTFRSQNVQNTPAPDHFWKLRWWKSARCCGAKHISKSKCTKHTMLGPLLEIEMSKKCTRLWREAHFEVKMLKAPGAWTSFGRSDVVSRGRRKGLWALSKVSKTWGFCGISKNDGRRGTLEEDLQRCSFRGRRSARDMFIRAVRSSGRWFLEKVCVLEHQIFRFVEMILRDRGSTSYDLASLFCGRRGTSDRWTGNIAKTHWYEAVSSALNFPSYRFPIFETSATALCGTTGKRMWAVHQVILEELTCSVAHAFGGAAGVVYPVVGIGVVSFVRSEHGSFNSFNWKGLEDIEKKSTVSNFNRNCRNCGVTHCGSTVRAGYVEFAPEPTAVRMSRYSPAQSNMLTCLIAWYLEVWGNRSCMSF